MRKLSFFLVFIVIMRMVSVGQTPVTDTTKVLEEVIIRAFEQNRRLRLVAAPIVVVGQSQLNRFNNTNILPALNANPGVRMEERSPGSYRLNIRGSSLRSPFGVRNVKVYFNDIPYTDPGGNTYLNQLGFYNFHSIEIIKGPGSSMYGAGTGGVVLISSLSKEFTPGLNIQYTAGSYGLHNGNVRIIAGTHKFQHHINFQHQVSDGYRDHSGMKRDALAWHSIIKWTNGQLRTHTFFGDLFYKTPGALTKTEYETNPRASRPAVGFNPSAVAAKAAIYQKMVFSGIVLQQKISRLWNNVTSLYTAYSQLKNPTFRNYGHATEPHSGGRTVFILKTRPGQSQLTWNSGAEWQKSFTKFLSYSNVSGNAGNLISQDKINNSQYLLFTQLDLALPANWIVTGGVSLNKIKLRVRRTYPGEPKVYERVFSNELAPRLSILKEIAGHVSVYASIAQGFSPPTIAEVLPSSNIINTNLEAEKGVNYEVGVKGNLLKRRFHFDVSAFYFTLKNTIVQRRDASGADFFVNAGSTSQKGIETLLNYDVINTPNSLLRLFKIGIGHTWHDFTYKEFKQLNADYSGNDLPSVSPHTVVITMDLTTLKGVYLNLGYSYTDKIPLNDANSEYATSFSIADARVGYHFAVKSTRIEFFGGINNALDERYSLGNDINGFGGRYYNAAAGRNWFVGFGFGK